MNYCLTECPTLIEAKVTHFKGCGSVCQKFQEMGIRPGVPIQVVGRLPFSSHVLVLVGNESFVFRQAEARCLEVCI